MDMPVPEWTSVTQNDHISAEMVEFDGEQRYMRVVTPHPFTQGETVIGWLLPINATMIDHDTNEQDEGFAFISIVGEGKDRLEALYQTGHDKSKLQ